VFALIRGDGSALLYDYAFILSASEPYDTLKSHGLALNEQRHLTNLSINKMAKGHPGQVVCHLPSEYPQVKKKGATPKSCTSNAKSSPFIYESNQFHRNFTV
jgi:hypothetical protein